MSCPGTSLLLTLQRYTLNDGGAAVGWSYTSTQRWKQKAPFVEGLYFAGHWVGPSGIYNVAVSGRNAAELARREALNIENSLGKRSWIIHCRGRASG